jgi:D-aminoacyl-tRNA deacylase
MRVVLQRVSTARVTVDGQTVGAIQHGWLALVGLTTSDTPAQLSWMAEKIVHLRCFPDDDAKMNRSLLDVRGSVLAVSNFTLYADCQKGRRPSFTGAAQPTIAEPLYLEFLNQLRATGVPVQAGIFGANMQIDLTNDGPITLILDTDFA